MSNPNNQQARDQQSTAERRPIMLDMVLALVIPLIDMAASQWLRWRAGSVSSNRSSDNATSNDVRPNGGAGMPVADVRPGSGTQTATTSPGLGVPNWRSDPR